MPWLTPPPGVRITSSGSGGSTDSWETRATAQTSMSAAELEAHYARQLEAGGWTRRDWRADGILAWSAWTVADDDRQWSALLYVLEEPTPEVRTIRLQLDADGGGRVGIRFVGP